MQNNNQSSDKIEQDKEYDNGGELMLPPIISNSNHKKFQIDEDEEQPDEQNKEQFMSNLIDLED